MVIGIRREDKNEWERRAPLTPDDVALLISNHDLAFHIQPSAIRAFPDKDYAAIGAEIREDLSACTLVLGVKEMPATFFRRAQAYMFFSHTIKSQPYNMPMLQRMLDLETTLIDYELVADEKGRRLIFFGRFAGLAGMIDTLHALGRRLDLEGAAGPLADIHMAHAYPGLEAAKEEIAAVGRRIRSTGLDPRVAPLVIGFAGYGNVSQGAQEILDLLPTREIAPAELAALRSRGKPDTGVIYKVVFKEEHLVVPRDPQGRFVLQDYYDHPEKYRSVFDEYVPHLSALVNCIFWTEKYPRLITKEFARRLFAGPQPPHLRVIGDISCDVHGSIEFTEKITEPPQPCFVYEPATGAVKDGYEGHGPVVMAIDNLPCELPIESSAYFGSCLREFLPAFKDADLTAAFAELPLSDPVKRAIIVHRGELRPSFAYLRKALSAAGN